MSRRAKWIVGGVGLFLAAVLLAQVTFVDLTDRADVEATDQLVGYRATDANTATSDSRWAVSELVSYIEGVISIAASAISDQDPGTDITTDLEEETHATEHLENAADEILAEDLGTACTDGQLIEADATGGLICVSPAAASYDPDRAPAIAGAFIFNEEFSGGTFDNVWLAVDADGDTITYDSATFSTGEQIPNGTVNGALGVLKMTATGADNDNKPFWSLDLTNVDGNDISASDWMVTAKIICASNDLDAAPGCDDQVVLHTVTGGTYPTAPALKALYGKTLTSNMRLDAQTNTDWDAFGSTDSQVTGLSASFYYAQMRYDATGDTLTFYISYDGYTFHLLHQYATITAPTHIGFYGTGAGSGGSYLDWFRVKNSIADPDFVGSD